MAWSITSLFISFSIEMRIYVTLALLDFCVSQYAQNMIIIIKAVNNHPMNITVIHSLCMGGWHVRSCMVGAVVCAIMWLAHNILHHIQWLCQ